MSSAAVALPITSRADRDRRGRLTVILGVLVVAGLLAVAAGQLFLGVMPQDEGELLVYPALIAAGKMPYRDIWMMYPPGTYFLLAGLLKVGFPGLAAERGLSLAVRLGYVALVNRSVSGSRRLSLLAVSVAGPLVLFDIRAYPWLVGLPLFYAGLLATRRRPTLAAALFLAATTIRFEFGAAGALALLGSAPLMADWRRRGAATLALIAGAAAFFGLLAVLTGGRAAIEIFYDPVARILPLRHLPLWPPPFSVVGYPLALTILIGPLATTALSAYRRDPVLFGTNLAILSLLPHFLQSPEWQYLLWMGASVVPWVLVSLQRLTRAPHRRPVEARLAAIGIRWIAVGVGGVYSLILLLYVAAVSPLSPASPQYVGAVSARTVSGAGHVILMGSAAGADEARAVVRYLSAHVRGGDRVYISPSHTRFALWDMTSLYAVLPLSPANPYLEMNPGIETARDVQQEIARSLGPRTWVILWRDTVSRATPAGRHPGSPFLAAYLRSHYRPAFHNAAYIILRYKR